MKSGSRDQSGAATSIGAVVGVVAILAVVLGILFVQGRSQTDDTLPASADETSSSAPTDESPSGESSSSDQPKEQEAWVAEAVVAAKDGFPAFVPAEVPAGWTATDATYAPDTSWHMELTAPSGETVSIDQLVRNDVALVVQDLLGKAQQTGTVNLRRWGTGTWQTWTAGDTVALAQELAGTVVVVSGATGKAEVVEITKQLLTAEMVVNVGDGSDG